MKINKKVLTGVSAAMLAVSVLAGCGAKNGGGASGSGQAQGQASQQDGPVKVSIMSILLSATPPANDNAIKKQIEKATNSELSIQWVSANSYNDKLNVALASGELPDLVYIPPELMQTTFRSAVQQGVFWDVTNYIKDYPNLTSKISKTAWDLSKMDDGKNYSIPRPRPSEADAFFLLRKDWLDNLNLKVPTTTDEFYQVLKAFKENDPDKNGKNDTIGLAANVTPPDKMEALGQLENAFTGANGPWKYVDGKLEYTAFSPEEHKALEYIQKLYQEKLIPEDFASLKASQVKDMVKAGKAGATLEKAGSVTEYVNELKKIDPNAKESDFIPITNLNGYNPKGPGFAGVLAIPKTVKEDKMKRILKLIDTWMNEDVFNIQQYGIEGVDYTVKDGVKVVDAKKLQEDGGPDFNQIVYVADPYASSVKNYFPKDVQELYKKIQDERAKTSVADVSFGLFSPTALQTMPEFQKKIQDMKVKVIMGRESLAAWDDFVNKMKADPNFLKVQQEMTEAYKKRAGAK
jgi:putative aldouronate transport system substrate-binding protein